MLSEVFAKPLALGAIGWFLLGSSYFFYRVKVDRIFIAAYFVMLLLVSYTWVLYFW